MSAKFLNIFSGTREASANNQIRITADTREKQSMVISCLISKNISVEFETLEIADYLVGDIAIERKTFSDFVSSMINKRLFRQLSEIKKYPKHFLIIEGELKIENKNLENAAKGMILSVITEYNIPIIFTKDSEDTADYLILLAKKFQKPKQEMSIRPSRSFQSIEKQKQFILEGFPNIGPVTAKRLLEEFKTIKNILGADREKLKSILGNKYEKFMEILEG